MPHGRDTARRRTHYRIRALEQARVPGREPRGLLARAAGDERLAAAGLARIEAHTAAEALEQRGAREPDLGGQLIDVARNQGLDVQSRSGLSRVPHERPDTV